MTVTLEMVVQTITVLAAVVGGFWALAKFVIRQFKTELDARFTAMEAARQEGQRQWYERLQRQENKVEALDADVRRILIEMPREYVTRADYVRRETIIEGKIDQLSLRIENWILQGGKNVG